MEKTIQRILIFAAFVAPLGAKVFALHTPVGEFSLFRISIFVAFLFYIVKRRGVINLSSTKSNSYSIVFFILLFLYSVVSAIWARSLSDWFRSVFFLFIAVITIILYAHHFKYRQLLVKPFKALFWGITIQSIIGWSEVLTNQYIYRPDAFFRPIIGSLGLPIAMQYNPNNFALLMYIGAGVAFLCMVQSKRFKLIYALGGTNFIVLAFLTASRSIIIAILLALAYIMLLSGRKKIALILIPFVVVLLFPQTVSYIQNTLQFKFSSNSGSDYTRVNLLKNGFDFVFRTFGLGVGAGQIPVWMQDFSKYDTDGVNAMHNWWMEMLTSYGVIMFCCYLRFYIKMFFDYQVDAIKTKNSMSLLICALMVGFIIAGVGPSSTLSLEWLWLFWGMCISGQGAPELEEDV